ncbi:PaaI family thioesterase [Planosporangium flavigriseum]|uniref:Phenylacetic acid degradation protein n=1 Tax=Planosporangium flavigriseum TaxID=373681 RepID=A0A8J3PQG0_9ACTN|nr:PaaI family thioesterase [Planosporangium flavigriseum]NJC67773.1 PaaI family thioesterase [Planosporangium flavigriseum]GIG76061.1 phenylacetic acid degradation protein [Planosporangium flavigriseum]
MTETQQAVRARTYTWEDPTISAAMVGSRSGLEFLQAIGTGEIPRPPVMQTLGITPIEVEPGRMVFGLQPQEFHFNPIGTMHGGVLATLLDSAAACAVQTTLPAGVGYTSLDLTTKFLRPVTLRSGALRCEGTVLSRGQRTALAQAQVFDDADRLIAHATSSCMIFPVDS